MGDDTAVIYSALPPTAPPERPQGRSRIASMFECSARSARRFRYRARKLPGCGSTSAVCREVRPRSSQQSLASASSTAAAGGRDRRAAGSRKGFRRSSSLMAETMPNSKRERPRKASGRG